MRVLEIIKEASILGSKYGAGHAVMLSSGSKGQKTLALIRASIPDFQSGEPFEKVAGVGPYPAGTDFNIPPDTTVINTSQPNAKNVIYAAQFKRRANGAIFTLIGTSDSIEGSLTHYQETKQGNDGVVQPKFPPRTKGLVAEALLGVAMYAKLIARGGDITAPITPDMIWSIVERVKPVGEDRLEDQVYDINNKIADRIHLSITIHGDVQQVLTNPEFRPIFADHVNSWVNYANSDLAQKYADALYKNNRPDSISIVLAGAGGAKLDVAINVLNADGTPSRRMEQVKLSVKLSDGLIGQKGRGDNPKEVYDNLVDLFTPLGVDLSKIKNDIMEKAEESGKATQFVPAMSLAYEEAYIQLSKLAKNAKGDASLAGRLAKLADHHATGGDPDIHVIEASSGGDYRLIGYKGLAKVFEKQNINIVCRLKYGTSTKTGGAPTPDLLFYDANDPSPAGRLVDIRVRGRGGEGKEYANHIIEPLPLMKELAAFRRFRKTS